MWFISPAAPAPIPANEREATMKRREFLIALPATAALPVAIGAATAASPLPSDKPVAPTPLERPIETVRGDMRYRALGRTGEEVSLVGLGGHHIGRQKEEKERSAIIRPAVDAGITLKHN